MHNKVDWGKIDWVLLDMDGTLLDLKFDNFFWQSVVPEILESGAVGPNARIRDTQSLLQHYHDRSGSLDWYSTDYWSEQLDVPIMALKKQHQHLIRYREDAEQFLARLANMNVTTILATNAHPDNLELKHQITGLLKFIDHRVVSHELKFAKENPLFWQTMTQYIDLDPQRALFIDDSETILDTAREFGIKELRCITHPDSQADPRHNLKYPAINCFSELF